MLECSLYIPAGKKEKKAQCILYCHGASGGRLDGITDVWEIGMQLEAALCVFDFAGCGHSQGDSITLGMWEEDDVRCVVRELVKVHNFSKIVLWGRSMGAVASIRAASHPPGFWVPPPPPLPSKDYKSWTNDELIDLTIDLEAEIEDNRAGASNQDGTKTQNTSEEAPKIKREHTMTCAPRTRDLTSMSKDDLIERVQELTTAVRQIDKIGRPAEYMSKVCCLILDSPFGNLWNASKHIIEHYKSVVPQFMLRGLATVGLPIVRKSILKQIPEFDIKKHECLSAASRCCIPALILHAVSDSLIPWEESRQIYDVYGSNPPSRHDLIANNKSLNIPSDGSLDLSPEAKDPSTSPVSELQSEQDAEAAGSSGVKKKKKKKETLPKLQINNAGLSTDIDLKDRFRISNRRASSPHNPPDPPPQLVSPKERMTSSDPGGSHRVARQYILVDGDHNSLRPASYYDAVANFLSRNSRGEPKKRVTQSTDPGKNTTRPIVRRDERGVVPNVVPTHLKKEGNEMRFYYGVTVISEYTDEEVRIERNLAESVKASSSPQKPNGVKTKDSEKKTLEDYVGGGVSCHVRTVSFSWRMVLGLHPRRGILVFRPYSGISLYAISFAELLSFHMTTPTQLRFMFLDGKKTQRRVRFYSPEVPNLKDHIDRSIRRLVSHDHMSTDELMNKITSNLAGASAALVEKRLLSSRGLSNSEVKEIVASLTTAIESMLSERSPDEIPEGLNPLSMVVEAVVTAVSERTGWKPDPTKIIPKEKVRVSNRNSRCIVS